jgi:hypothetical protein
VNTWKSQKREDFRRKSPYLLIFEGDHTADLRRAVALRVREARAHLHLHAIRENTDERSHGVGKPAGARIVPNNFGLFVVEELELEKGPGAAVVVHRARLPEHDPLAAFLYHDVEHLHQVVLPLAELRPDHGDIRGTVDLQRNRVELLVQKLHALFVLPAVLRRVEHEVVDELPVVVAVVLLPLDDPHRLLEKAAPAPELPVQRKIRHVLLPRLRALEDVALARIERVAVPVGADAVELLAHDPIRWILRFFRVVPLVRQHHGARVAGHRWLLSSLCEWRSTNRRAGEWCGTRTTSFANSDAKHHLLHSLI